MTTPVDGAGGKPAPAPAPHVPAAEPDLLAELARQVRRVPASADRDIREVVDWLTDRGL